jgi:hypothetical protein
MEITSQRNKFMDSVHNLLTSIGFTNTNEVYEWNRQIQQRGQTIIINGQRMDQPGQTITILYRIEILGDGCVMDESDNIEQEFTHIRFEFNGDIHEECFYWDDFTHFENIIKQIIR